MNSSLQNSNQVSQSSELVFPDRPTSTSTSLELVRQLITQAAQRFQSRNISDYVNVIPIGATEDGSAYRPYQRTPQSEDFFYHVAENGRLTSFLPSGWSIEQVFNQGNNSRFLQTFSGANGASPLEALLYRLGQIDTDHDVKDLSDPTVKLSREYQVAKLTAFENFAAIAKAFGIDLPANMIPDFGTLQDGGYNMEPAMYMDTRSYSNQDPSRIAFPITGYRNNNSDPTSVTHAFEDGSAIYLGNNGIPLARVSATNFQAIESPLATYNSLLQKSKVDNFLAQRGAPPGSVAIMNGRADMETAMQEAGPASASLRATVQNFPAVRRPLNEDTSGLFYKAKAQFGVKSATDYLVVHGYRTPDGKEVMFEDGPQIVLAQTSSWAPTSVMAGQVGKDVEKYMTDFLYGSLGKDALSPVDYIRERFFGKAASGTFTNLRLPLSPQ